MRERCAENLPETPRALMGKRPSPIDGKPYLYPLTAKDIHEWLDQAQHTFKFEGAARARQDKLRARWLRRLAWWENREQAILYASGYPALKAKANALDAEQDRLITAITCYEARTIGDLAAKVQFLGNWAPFAEIDIEHPEEMGVVEITYVSLWMDVRRLSGKDGAA